MARPSAGVVILQMKAEVPAGGFAAAAKALAVESLACRLHVNLLFFFLTLNQLEEINLSNTKAFVYTCNDPREITQLWDAGLSGVITDDPLKFI